MFANSAITPAARANDASDVFVIRGGDYIEQPAQPFRSATLDHIQCGHVDCRDEERSRGADLGLYSVTFTNRLDDDLRTLEEYRRFRIEAERVGFRHFLEVFDPNVPTGMAADALARYVNDSIARTLAGVATAGRPLFLKVVYHGPRAMEELVAYDPHLIVGILGGGAGTTYDAFKLISEAQKYGARVALFGRKINNAECQLAFVEFLRLIVNGDISPEAAVRAYHAVLEKLGIRPHRTLEDDMQLQTGVMSYGGSASVTAAENTSSRNGSAAPPNVAGPITKTASQQDCGCGCGGANGPGCSDQPANKQMSKGSDAETIDFSQLTQAEKVSYNQARRDRIFG
jgi:hypothetical protein